MVRSLALILGAALAAGSLHAELLLTPTISEYELDGVKLKQLAFADGAITVTYQAPRGWAYTGSATRLALLPPGKAQAEATISRIPMPEPVGFDEEGLEKLVTQAVEGVPKGSTDVAVISREKNPIMIQRKETFLVVLGYTFYGQHYSRSILFLNRGDEQIRAQLSCLEPDFKDLQRAFFASQYTWQGL